LNRYDCIILRSNDSLLPMSNVTQDRQTYRQLQRRFMSTVPVDLKCRSESRHCCGLLPLLTTCNYLWKSMWLSYVDQCATSSSLLVSLFLSQRITDYRMFHREAYRSLPDVCNAVDLVLLIGWVPCSFYESLYLYLSLKFQDQVFILCHPDVISNLGLQWTINLQTHLRSLCL